LGLIKSVVFFAFILQLEIAAVLIPLISGLQSVAGQGRGVHALEIE
jgi:hypothetical protein